MQNIGSTNVGLIPLLALSIRREAGLGLWIVGCTVLSWARTLGNVSADLSSLSLTLGGDLEILIGTSLLGKWHLCAHSLARGGVTDLVLLARIDNTESSPGRSLSRARGSDPECALLCAWRWY